MLEHDFILLDRSGSMAYNNLWTEALAAVNGYVRKLAEQNVNTGVTLVVFDGDEPFKIIRDRITPSTWKPVTNEDATPRGMTPLYDSTAKLVSLAERGAPWGQSYDKVSIVIMTDGDENASHEFRSPKAIKDRLDACRNRGWQVTFLGANFDNVKQATVLGAAMNATVSTTAANYTGTMELMAGKRAAYSTRGMAMSWTPDEQLAAKTDTKFTLNTDATDNSTKAQ